MPVVSPRRRPNVTGIASVDQAAAAELTELAIKFCLKELKPDGVFVVKVFQGAGFEPFVKLMRENRHFGKIVLEM